MTAAALDAGRRLQVERETRAWIERASLLTARTLPQLEIRFDLRGRQYGQYRVGPRGREIRFNPWAFAADFEHHVAHTVPHEVAHFVVDVLYQRRRVRPHGAEWREVMAQFGVPATVTCDRPLGASPLRRQRRFEYRCRCRAHLLTTTRHRRVGRGLTYFCRHCREPLVRVNGAGS